VDDLGEGPEGQESDEENPPPHCMRQLDGVMIPGARRMPRVFWAAQKLGCSGMTSDTLSLVFELPCHRSRRCSHTANLIGFGPSRGCSFKLYFATADTKTR